jgi:multisubunit Na+/H+ antiporter MnhE subunit
MEEIFAAIFSAFAELLFEVFCQVVVEAVAALIARSFRNLFEESNVINPILAAIGYLILGLMIGAVSLHIFPHPLVRPSRFHGISLIISPLITGLVMSQVGVAVRRNGGKPVRVESFGYGFTLALGLAAVRLMFLK